MSFLAAVRFVPWWAYVGAVLLAMLGAQTHRLAVVKQSLTTEQRDRAAERVRLVQAGLDAVTAARAEESRRAAAHLEAARAAELALSQARADGAAAASAARGLRARAAALAARCDRSASHPGLAAPSAPAEAPGDMLAELLSRAAERAVELAGYADSARIAGAACERAYEALR